MEYKISVIVPTYQPGGYLWECLEALRNQTFPLSDFEVLIVLNGKETPWRNEIDKYISDNKIDNYTLLYTPQSGVSNARNIALDNAKGEYIAFIDDDDFVSPSYLDELYKHASPEKVSLCYPLSFVDGTQEYKPYLITRDYIKNIENCPCDFKKARRFFSGPVYKLIHKDIIGNRRFNVKFRNGEDSIFMFEISDALKMVDFTSKNAVYHRRVRIGSALLRKKSSLEVWGNCIRMISAYTGILIKHPFRYSCNFYITRLLGAIHGAIEQYQLRRGKTL